jgi:ubiquitin carboxyl-terminal hydrolase 1
MSDYGPYSFDDSYRRWGAPVSNTSLTWILLSTVFGAYIFLKALEVAGFPIWLWVAQRVDMATAVLRPSGETSEGTMQRAGGLLSSVFGFSGESLLQKSVSRFTSALSSGPSNVPPGLGNISNSCYQNSVIQGLAALPSVRDYLATITDEYPSFTADSTNGALHELLDKLNDPANLGHNFWIRGKLKSMSTFTQQDAQEYFSKILDDMDNEVKKATSSKRRSSVSWLESTKTLSNSPDTRNDANSSEADKQAATEQVKAISNPLDGLIAQRVGCTSCGYSEGLSLINFNCITVSLGNNSSYDIRECLDEYTKLEYIDGVECAKCTLLKTQKTLTPLATPGSLFEAKLKAVSEIIEEEKFEDNTLVKTLNIPKKNWVQSSKSKQIVVARAPKALVLHINRSIFDEMTGAQYKNLAGVTYPRILDLGNWCLGTSPSGSRQPDIPLEEWPRDPRQSMLQETDEPTTTSPFQYRLRAAVTHFGSHGNGHYVCYRPHARLMTQPEEGQEDEDQDQYLPEEQWWRFSDDTVYAVHEEQAHQGSVFMLFYERLDEPMAMEAAEAESLPVLIPVTEDAPLPTESTQDSKTMFEGFEMAVEVPLPEEDDLLDLIPPESSTIDYTTKPEEYTPLESFVEHTPIEQAPNDTETETSEAESEDAPSTQVTSDSEAEPAGPPTPKPSLRMPPRMMRTAGNTTARGQGSRRSLQMVPPT